MNHRTLECPPIPAIQKYSNIIRLWWGGDSQRIQQYQEEPECSHLEKFLKFDILKIKMPPLSFLLKQLIFSDILFAFLFL